MPPGKIPKHNNPQSRLPTARGIRRACSKELYRTCKRLPVHIAPDLVKQGEELYCRNVAGHHLDRRKPQQPQTTVRLVG